MSEATRYPVPAGRHRVEQTIRRSRFITTVSRAEDGDAARAFIGAMRAEFADATHNCWAWVAGPPGTTADIGMSDAGEPHGTAGRPMLEALLHSGVGEIVAVVTRYYGGVKLGTGGLQRAYSGGVQLALEGLARMERVARTPLVVVVEYGGLDAVRRVIEEMDGEVDAEEFGVDVRLDVAVPADSIDAFARAVAEATAGRALVERPATGDG